MKKAMIFVLSLMMIAIFAVGCSTDKSDTAATVAPAAATVEATSEAVATAEATTAPAADTTTEATATAATQG